MKTRSRPGLGQVGGSFPDALRADLRRTAGGPPLARAWPLLPLAALLAMLWACSGGLPGVPVADDFAFLARVLFQRPLDPFDSMGASYYWRPLSRQLYFSLVVSPWPGPPWLLGALHVALLLLTAGLARAVARSLAGSRAGWIAFAAVLASEPARVLIAWPSGSQHLLGAVGALLALREALARRPATAALAALLGVLSHESAAIVIPLLPLASWWAARVGDPHASTAKSDSQRAVLIAWLAAAALATVWLSAYAVSLRHGVRLPPGPGMLELLERWPRLAALALSAALNVEDLRSGVRLVLLVPQIVLVLLAIGWAWRRPEARGAALAAILVGIACWAIGLLPLGALLPDWNAWRAWVPTIGLILGLAIAFGPVPAPLGLTWVALRLAGLLLAPQPEALVSAEPPESVSDVSFVRLTRLQRLVSATRREVLALPPSDAGTGVVRYWNIPRVYEIGFQESVALRVWLRDPTARWEGFGGRFHFDRPHEPVLEYLQHDPAIARRVPIGALRQLTLATLAIDRADTAEAISHWSAMIDSLGYRTGKMYGLVLHNLALIANARFDWVRADSLHRLALKAGYDEPSSWTLGALLALERGDRATARADIERALALDPDDEVAARVARMIGIDRPAALGPVFPGSK